MHTLPPDPLLDRLRAADPGAAIDATAIPARERVTAARRRRTMHRRRRAGAIGGLATALAVVALTLAPGGSPSDSAILVRAVQASELPHSAILAIDSRVTERDDGGGFTQHHLTWLRTSRSGKILAARVLTPSASDPRMLADTTSGPTHTGASITAVYDARTGRVSSMRGTMTPSSVFVLEVHRLLTRARAAGPRVRIARHPARAGHPGYDALARTTRIAAHVVQRHEIRLDPRTYAPTTFVDDEHGLDSHGKPFTYHLVEQIVRERTLPDTPRNRRLLELRGPTR
jgi:hypothetical protein